MSVKNNRRKVGQSRRGMPAENKLNQMNFPEKH